MDRDPKTLARLQTMVTSLIEKRVSSSLAELEAALARWRSGELSALETHGAVLKHAARCERTVERVTSGITDRPDGVVRDAFDSGLLTQEEFVEFVGVEPSQVTPANSLSNEDHLLKDKRSAIEELLERGPVLLHLDATRDDVLVPEGFRADPRLVLRFGYRLQPPIVDLALDSSAISGTLTFSGRPSYCRIAWPAIWAAIVEGEQRGVVWQEDVPVAAVAPPTETTAEEPAVHRGTTEESGKRRASHLRLVE